MKIMMISFLTLISLNAKAFISDAMLGSRMHELFCATPAGKLEELSITHNPNLTGAEFLALLELKNLVLTTLKSSKKTAAQFDRNPRLFIETYEMLEAGALQGRPSEISLDPVVSAYVGCQASQLMRTQLQKAGCPEAGIGIRESKATITACDTLLEKSKALAQRRLEK